ncbi:hypothetical protein [Bradyrhizobium sp. sBnM-33]|nr:hypothetical protein [Bradyrhizobium sp. sBnM-33]WOH51399.1 hypothetical protein RX328_03655 [Bradyrhizobium sp. sBnM-33]
MNSPARSYRLCRPSSPCAMSGESDRLKREVGKFLNSVRAA